MANSVTTKWFFDTRRERQDKKYPLKLRVTYQRVSKYYLFMNLTKKDYEKLFDPKWNNKKPYKKYRLDMAGFESKAIEIIDSLPFFTFDAFAKKFLSGDSKTYNDVFLAFDKEIEDLKSNNRFNTASIYETAKKSFKDYHKKKTLKFTDITDKFLEAYEYYMLSEQKSRTSISINTRCLRKVFNDGIKEGNLHVAIYPFGKSKYTPPKHRNIKKALNKVELAKIYRYKPRTETEAFYRDIWLFSYVCYGLNMADIARLKYSNIEGNKIIFVRQKTSSQNETRQLQILLNDISKEIIEKYGTGKGYIFPVINDEMTAEEQYKAIKQFTKQTNKYVQRIAKELEIPYKVSTYFARHSFATICREDRIPESTIGQLLGHANKFGVTGDYLSDVVPDSRLIEVNKVITEPLYNEPITQEKETANT